MHKASSIKKWFSWFGVEELDCPAQSPDLNPIQHLDDELERRLQARSYHPMSVLDLPNPLVQHLVEGLKPEEGRLLQQQINAHSF